MANALDSHTFPTLTAAYLVRADYHRRCPHCSAPENVIETAPYSRSTLHCPLCGWSAPIRCRREPVRRITHEVRRRSDDCEEQGPRVPIETKRAINEDLACVCCGDNPRIGLSVYCPDCKKLKQREANQRFKEKSFRDVRIYPVMIEELASELTEYMRA